MHKNVADTVKVRVVIFQERGGPVWLSGTNIGGVGG